MTEIERPEVEGVIVEGRHPISFGGTCLTCGRPDYSPGCDEGWAR